MHDIEPYYKWRHTYISSEDDRSPHFGRVYDEFTFTQKVYNYFIHPQWDEFGSSTLYAKILFADYDNNHSIIELIGEWNDCLNNDIMFLKQNVIDPLQKQGISKFILLCDNVLNFHGSDNCYYEEWFEEVSDEMGWIVFVNLREHLVEEMYQTSIDHYIQLGPHVDMYNWRSFKPAQLIDIIDEKRQMAKPMYLP